MKFCSQCYQGEKWCNKEEHDQCKETVKKMKYNYDRSNVFLDLQIAKEALLDYAKGICVTPDLARETLELLSVKFAHLMDQPKRNWGDINGPVTVDVEVGLEK